METASNQLFMEEGGVELTLSNAQVHKQLQQEKPNKSFFQRIRTSPKLSSGRKNRDNQRSVIETSFDSNSILIGDETYTYTESASPKADWGISWSSSTMAKSESLPDNSRVEKQHQFEKKDFRKSTWLGAIKKGSYSTYGVAALMTASAIIVHPILILAGVVWAVGAFRALDKEYNLFNDKTFSSLFWSSNEETDPVGGEKNPHNNQETKQEEEKKETEVQEAVDQGDVVTLENLPLKSLINLHFPPLEATVLSNVSFSGLNAVDFFDVFYSDEAPFSMKDFQSSRGDIDLNYERWANCEDMLSSSMHPAAKATHQLPPLSNVSRRQRKINFKTLTRSYFGPAYASAEKKTIVTKVSKDYIVLESQTKLSDIPFSDRFFVVERWYIDSTDDGQNTDSYCKINLTVGIEVVMIKECTFERQIRQKTIEGVTEILKSWTDIAREALEITAQSKLGNHKEDIENGLLPWACFSDTQMENVTDDVVHDEPSKTVLGQHEERFEEMELYLQRYESIELELANSSMNGKAVKVVFHDDRNLTIC